MILRQKQRIFMGDNSLKLHDLEIYTSVFKREIIEILKYIYICVSK